MTLRERRRAAMSHAYRYQAYEEAVKEYRARVMAQRGQRFDAVPGSTSAGSHSAPTEQMAIRLVDMPEAIRTKALWVKAIEDAWAECVHEDYGDPHGLAFIMEKVFRLTGKALGPEHNAAIREQIIQEAHITKRTFYSRLDAVTDILIYHAARRKLL